MILASFLELPLWQKPIALLVAAILSPMVVMVVVALLPLQLLGPWEGELGAAPLARDVTRAVRRQQARTEHYYAT